MKKGIIGIIIAAVIVVGGYFTYKHFESNNNGNLTQSTGTFQKVSKATNTEVVHSTKVQFTKDDISNYYKLSQVVGDIGMPSSSLTVNLKASKNIGGVNYYKTYSYNTRAAYNNDNSKVENGNYSHMINSKVVSLAGKSISDSEFGNIDTSNISSKDKYNDIYQIAAQYVEGYTANNPKLVVSTNDNYEGDLNAEPDMTVNMNSTKTINGQELYEVTIAVNGYKTNIYVGLDGYIFVGSQNDYYQLFFPNKLSNA